MSTFIYYSTYRTSEQEIEIDNFPIEEDNYLDLNFVYYDSTSRNIDLIINKDGTTSRTTTNRS
jgi:hypothetical protein